MTMATAGQLVEAYEIEVREAARSAMLAAEQAGTIRETGPDDAERDGARRLWALNCALPAAYRAAPSVLRERVSPAARAIVDRYARGESLLLTGRTGAGKTTVAALVVLKLAYEAREQPELWRTTSPIRWTSALELAVAEHESRLGEEPSVFRECRTRPLVVINDLGKEHDATGLWRVLDARYEARLPTIATTALTDAELTARYPQDLARRLQDRNAGWKVARLS